MFCTNGVLFPPVPYLWLIVGAISTGPVTLLSLGWDSYSNDCGFPFCGLVICPVLNGTTSSTCGALLSLDVPANV